MKRLLLIAALLGLPLTVPYVASATVSGENGRIAFARNGDIWTVNRAGTKQIRVTHGPLVDDYPEWSPNGKWISFTRWEADGFERLHPTIFRIHLDGTRLTRIVAGIGATWAPDGKRIAYAT